MTVQAAQTAQQSAYLKRPGWIERALVVLMVIVFSFSLPTEWFLVGADAVTTGGALVQLTFLAFFGIAILGMMGNWHVALHALSREPLLPGLIGFAMLSSLWSTDPFGTFTTTFTIAITLTVSVYLIMRFSLEEIIYMVAIALAIGVIINFMMVFAFPSSGLQSDRTGIDGAWSGVFRSRNNLARITVISVVIFIMAARLRRSFFVWPTFILLATVQVIGTQSATGLGALFASISLLVVFLGFRGRKHLYGATTVALGTVFGLVLAAAAINLSGLTALVGRDATFTGRLPLWQASFAYGIPERPWLGYGWAAFWGNGNTDFPVQLRLPNFDTPHAHNAFVDAWLFAGPLAAAILAALYVRGLFWAARNIRRDPTITGMFPAMMISLSVLFSLSETGFVGRSSGFILLSIALMTASRNKGVQVPFVPKVKVEAEQPRPKLVSVN